MITFQIAIIQTHMIGEELIKLGMLQACEEILRNQAILKLKVITTSANTAKCRIKEMAKDVSGKFAVNKFAAGKLASGNFA